MSATPYLETEIVFAQLEEDYERRDKLIADMLPNERLAFHFTLDEIMHAMHDPLNTALGGITEP